jgi:transcriptional regulator with XRE-family HTH domain
MTGEELRRAIGAFGMTQAAFADKMGVTRSTVYRWLSGQLPVPVYVESYLVVEQECQRLWARVDALMETRR